MGKRQRDLGLYDKSSRRGYETSKLSAKGLGGKGFFHRYPILGSLFHYLMIVVLGALAFGIGGGLAILLAPRRIKAVMDDKTALIIFSGGGIFTVGWLIVTYFRKIKRSVI